MKKMFGWYSAHADREFGHCIYRTPEGLEVKVTEVTSNEKPTGKWNDFVCLGEVTDCIKTMDIDWDQPLDALWDKAQAMLAQQKSCQAQFKTTGKCFCHTCPIKYNVN